MGKKRMIAAIFFLVLVSSSGINGEFHEHLYYIHSPAVIALAPNIVSFETGALSSIENPALSSVEQSTGVYYEHTQWYYYSYPKYLDLASIKSYYKWFSFSLTAYNLDFYGPTKSLIGNFSARLGAGFTIGVNVNFLNEYLSSGVKNFSDLNADAGLNYCGKIKTGKISNCLMIGLASNSLSSIKQISLSDFSLKGGIAYRIADEENFVPMFESITVFAEAAARFFSFDPLGGYVMNFFTYGAELRVLEGLALRIGNTNSDISGDEYFNTIEDLWALNYGIGYSIKYDKFLFKKDPLFVKLDLCKIPLYHNVVWLILPSEYNISGYSFSVEISTKIGL